MSEVHSLDHSFDLIKAKKRSSDGALPQRVAPNAIDAGQLRPIIHVHTSTPVLPTPWYNSSGVISVLLGALLLAAFTLSSLNPLIRSASSVTDRLGDVIGTVSTLGDRLGGTIHVVNRFGNGLVDGIGDVRCAIIGGKGCDREFQSERCTESDLGGSNSAAGDLDSIASLVSTLSELSLVPLELGTDIR